MTDPATSGFGAEGVDERDERDEGDERDMVDDFADLGSPDGVEDSLGPPAGHEDLMVDDEDEAASVGASGDAAVVDGPADDLDLGHEVDGEVTEPVGPVDRDPGVDHGAVDRRGSSVEELIADLERTIAERDDYLDQLRRNQADFENARRRLTKEATDSAARSTESLVDKLLPVLDACDAAIAHGAGEVEPVFASLLGSLEKEGLERIAPAGEAFDPNRHEAVLHEPVEEGDEDGDEGTVVSEVLRTGYGWKGRIVRPAMVKVRG